MTERIERQEWKIGSGDDEIRLNVWDFGGQEIMHATHQFFLTKLGAKAEIRVSGT